MTPPRIIRTGAGPYREALLRAVAPPRVRRGVWVAVALTALGTLAMMRAARPTPGVFAATPRVRVPPPPRPTEPPEPPVTPLMDVVHLAHGSRRGTWLALTRDGSLYTWGAEAQATELATRRARVRRVAARASFDRVDPALDGSCGHAYGPFDAFVLWSQGVATWASSQEGGGFAVDRPSTRGGAERVTLSDATDAVRIWRDAAGLVRVLADCEPGEHHYPDLAIPAPPLDVPGVTEVSAGRSLACASTDGGAVWCWSFSTRRPESVSDARDYVVLRSGPHRVPVVPVAGVVADARRGACGVARDGSVWCWRPDPQRAARWRVAQHPWLREVARLHGLGHALCATLRGGRFVCDHEPRATPGAVSPPSRTEHPGLRGALQVVFGGHSGGGCARFEDGSARCWGSGDLPDGRLRASRAPVRADVPDALRAIGAGESHACGLTREGAAWCWGDDRGDGTVGRAARVEGLPAVAQLAVGARDTCALQRDGAVVCWGRGGDDSHPLPAAPRRMEGLDGAVEVSAGAAHACARLADGAVRCWGELGGAWPGHPRVLGAVRPLGVALPEPADALVSVGAYACARMRSGPWRCWGGGGYEDERGDTVEASLAAAARPVGGATAPLDSALDGSVLRHGLVVDDRGGARRSLDGYPFAEDVSAVARSAASLCFARHGSGAVSCHALDARAGEGGRPPPGDAVIPRRVRALAAGDGFACALDAEGAAWCWGANDRGQLGTGAPAPVPEAAPTRVVR